MRGREVREEGGKSEGKRSEGGGRREGKVRGREVREEGGGREK